MHPTPFRAPITGRRGWRRRPITSRPTAASRPAWPNGWRYGLTCAETGRESALTADPVRTGSASEDGRPRRPAPAGRTPPLRYLLLTARPIAEDLLGTFAFYLLYLLTGSPRLAAGVGLALGLAQLGWHLVRRRRPPTLLLIGVALTLLLGGLTLATADPRFLLLKPSIVYAMVGSAMLPRGWVLRYVPAVSHDLLPRATFDRVGWAWAALLFATALANLLLVATLPPRLAAGLLAIGATASKLMLFGIQYAVLSRRAMTARNRQIS